MHKTKNIWAFEEQIALIFYPVCIQQTMVIVLVYLSMEGVV
jgi:hypothetical protein